MLGNLAQNWATKDLPGAFAWANNYPPSEIRDNLFRHIALAVPQGERLELYDLDLETARFSAITWPAEWSGMESRLLRRRRGEPLGPSDPMPQSGLLEVPRFGLGPSGGGEQEWLLLELDVTYTRAHKLPDLLVRHLGAGGINGLFLAKALANGQEFAPLKELWITEGDIDALLNEKASYKDIKFAETDTPPQSLLNSDRMYVKLLDALRGMEPSIPPMKDGKSPLVDEIDLYVTTTDIRGAVVPLPW